MKRNKDDDFTISTDVHGSLIITDRIERVFIEFSGQPARGYAFITIEDTDAPNKSDVISITRTHLKLMATHIQTLLDGDMDE